MSSPTLQEAFRERFGAAEQMRTFRAPGRVNIIGEHTDYNLGFVCPVALDMACYIGATPSKDGKLRIYSEHHDEMREFAARDVAGLTPQRHWTDYPVGVAQQLARAGFGLDGMNLFIRSTVPEGSGLSSSAALEVSSALSLLYGRQLDKLELAKLCQRAEREFVGMPCGIMDQYISVFGEQGAAIKIDCRSLEYELVTLPSDVVFIAVNTMVKHELASSAYKERTEECAAAVEMIREKRPEVASLRDAVMSDLDTLPGKVRQRARHNVTENQRVNDFLAASSRGDTAEMGRLMVESHRSLQHDYEVSCAELDFLVDTALGIPGVIGARMTGGGFGGCMVAMMRPEAAGDFRSRMVSDYEKKFEVTPQVYDCRPSAGAGEIR